MILRRDKEYTPPPPTVPEPQYQPSSYRPAYQFPTQPAKEKFSKPVIAGTLLLIASIIALIYVPIMLSAIPSIVEQSAKEQKLSSSEIDLAKQVGQVCVIAIIILAIFALVGGIMALRKKTWALALTGSILGLFTFGPIAICSILSLIALILIATSRKDFSR